MNNQVYQDGYTKGFDSNNSFVQNPYSASKEWDNYLAWDYGFVDGLTQRRQDEKTREKIKRNEELMK